MASATDHDVWLKIVRLILSHTYGNVQSHTDCEVWPKLKIVWIGLCKRLCGLKLKIVRFKALKLEIVRFKASYCED